MSVVLATCRAYFEGGCTSLYPVRINQEAVTAFVSSHLLDTVDRIKTIKTDYDEKGGFPLKFDSIHDEVNFLVLLHALNFGSVYEPYLLKLTGRNVADTIMYGLISIHMRGKINSAFMVALSQRDVADFFAVPLDEEITISRGITSTKRSSVYPFVEMLHRRIVDMGTILWKLGKRDMSAFLFDLQETVDDDVKSEAEIPKPSAAITLNVLTSTFQAFNDVSSIRRPDGTSSDQISAVSLFRNAQLLLADLYALRSREVMESKTFDFCDFGQCTIASDSYVVNALFENGILEYESDLCDIIAAQKEISAEKATAIRAAAVLAAHSILDAVNNAGNTEGMHAMHLDYFLRILDAERKSKSVRFLSRSEHF